MAIKIDLGRVEVVTMRELTLHTAKVIDRVRTERRSRLIVRHGRFQAWMHPIDSGREAWVVREATKRGMLVVQSSGPARTVDDLLGELEAEEAASEDEGPHAGPDAGGTRTGTFGVVTMSELNRAPSRVIDQVRSGASLIVTKHGRMCVLLATLPDGVEAALLREVPGGPGFLKTADMGSRDGVAYGFKADVAAAMMEGDIVGDS